MATRKTPTTSKTPTSPDIDHDGSYRKLFGEAAMVQDLLKWDYIPRALTADLNTDAEMMPLNMHHALPNERGAGEKKKEGDAAYRVPNRVGAAALYTFLMLEFQSGKDLRMAMRIAVYAALIWLQASRTDPGRPEWASGDGDAPCPILPIVLYNGATRWTRSRPLRQRVQCGKRKALRAMQLDIDYHLIDIGALELPATTRGPCDVLFALERTTEWDELGPLVKQLLGHLQGPETASLREAFLDFMLEVLVGRGMTISRQTVRDLQGLYTMLGQNIDKMREKDRQQGLQQGLQQGMVAGRLGRLLTASETERLITYLVAHPMTIEQLAQASPEDVAKWIAPAGAKNGTNGRGKR